MEAQQKLREFIEINLNENLDEFDPVIKLSDDDDIFKLGISDSLFVMKLLKFVEDEFDVKVESDELEIDNFSSVNNVMRLIERMKEKRDN